MTGPMETLHQALARLEKSGFEEAFRPTKAGELTLPAGDPFPPETLVVEETVRFEGNSDPEDEAILFALRSQDGRVRGTFVATYGASMDPESAAVMERLAPDPNRPRTGSRC